MDLFKPKALAIVGTAGRKDDAPRLVRGSFEIMLTSAKATIAEWNVRRGVSGGAAWADHLAVAAYLDGVLDSLHLHFPSRFINGKFEGAGDGAIANHYHAKFSQVRDTDTLAEIAAAIAKGAEVSVGNGFKNRNLAVGREATHMLAFTFGAGNSETFDSLPADTGFRNAIMGGLKDGGTAFCWSAAKDQEIKRHIDLGLLLAPAFDLADQLSSLRR